MEEIYYQVVTIVALLVVTYIKASAAPTYKSFKNKLSQISEVVTRIDDLIKEIERALEDDELSKAEVKIILS